MAEMTEYFENISAARSIAHFAEDEEGSLAGTPLLSIESESSAEQGVFVFAPENFSTFLRYVRFLRPQDQELILAYYILRKTPFQLAPLFQITQTVASFRLRLCVKTICAMILFGGVPTEEQLRPVLNSAGLEEVLLDTISPSWAAGPGKERAGVTAQKFSLAKIVAEYTRLRSFAAVAALFDVHRPEIRRYISRAAQALMESPDLVAQAAGSFCAYLIGQQNPNGKGFSRREQAKQGDKKFRDTDECGMFRITLDENPDEMLDSLFASQANL